jgi:hypothetical protein
MGSRTLTLLDRGVWRIDHSLSTVCLVRHLGVATVHGRFSSFAGRIDVTNAGLRVDGIVDVASVNTGNGIRDGRYEPSSSTPSASPRLRSGPSAPCRRRTAAGCWPAT